MTIDIRHGVYDIEAGTQYDRNGYWNDESRSYMSLCNKFSRLLARKGKKFFEKYGFDFIRFTLGIDKEKGIEVITICHSEFDDFDECLGEDIVVGRIERMRGDLKKVIYEKEEFEKKIKLYDKKYDGFNKVEAVYKTITCKRVKLDNDGNPVIRRKIYHKPYDLNMMNPDIKHKDGSITYGGLMYPYICLE